MSLTRLLPFSTPPRFAEGVYALFYSGQFVLLGVQLPFFAGWLTLNGFTAAEIGLLTGAALIVRLIVGPFIAFWADHQDDERGPLQIFAALFALGALCLVFFEHKYAIAAAAVAVYLSFGMLVPLTDTAVLRADRNGWLQYGRTRAVGSFAFLTTTIAGGYLFSRAGISAAAPAMAAAAMIAFAATFVLPQVGGRGGAKPGSLREAPRLLAKPVFAMVLVSAGLTQGAHAVYYAFSYLRWSEIGYSDVTIGVLWATGVVAEIFVLTFARRLLRRYAPLVFLAIGALATAVRWALTATEPPLALLFAIQVMHALTFAATYLASVEFIDRAVPLRLVNTAMTVMSATGVGAVTGVATIVAGYVWTGQGPAAAYLMMAAMGAVALALALLAARQWRGGLLFE